MKILISGFLALVLCSEGQAQWYAGGPIIYGGSYAPYPNVTVIYPPSPPVVVSLPTVLTMRDGPPAGYLIAFKDGTVRMASTYWVTGNTLYYMTVNHVQIPAPLDSVDRQLSQYLNSERNVSFPLPVETQKAELRQLLLKQFRLILDTRESPRGLVITISDVLFGFDRYSLTSAAREKLAKIAGILLSYESLCPQVEGYTDDVGGDQYNLRLSLMRAASVRDYLVSQGVPAAKLTAMGFGKINPVASNATALGRQQNRRVELVIAGEAIGVTETPPAYSGLYPNRNSVNTEEP